MKTGIDFGEERVPQPAVETLLANKKIRNDDLLHRLKMKEPNVAPLESYRTPPGGWFPDPDRHLTPTEKSLGVRMSGRGITKPFDVGMGEVK